MVLLGAIIFGTTLILSKPGKPTVNAGLGNFTTTAQLVTTALIPDKVVTTVSFVFTAPPPVISTFSALPTAPVKDVTSPATTTTIVRQSSVNEGPLSPSPPSTKPTTAEEVAVSSKPTLTTTTIKEVTAVTKPPPSTTTTKEVAMVTKPSPTTSTINTTTTTITTTTTVATTTTTTTTTEAAAVVTKATTTTASASPTPTKGSGWIVFPGITIPNPFEIFKPTDPPKSTATLAPTTTTTTKAVVKTATTTTSTTTAASPSPTKKSGWTLFPGIAIPNPFDLFPHEHDSNPTKGKTEFLARQGPAVVDAIDNNDDEQEDEHEEDENEGDFDDKQGDEEEDMEEIEQVEHRLKQDQQGPAKIDTNEDWVDEEVEPKQQAKKADHQKVLKQRSLLKKRQRHHHHLHRRNNQKRHLVRRQKLPFHDVVQIARTISVSPPTKTMHLLTETPTPTPVAVAPSALPHTAGHVDPNNVFVNDAHSKKGEKPSTPLVPPQSPAFETNDAIFEEFKSVIAQLVDEQAASFEESLDLIVNNIIQSDEMESYQDLLFERIAVSKLEIPDTNDNNAFDFNADDKVEALYSFLTSPSKDSIIQNPRAVSRTSMLTSIINTLLPPFVLRFRADLRNFLFWICSPTASAHIDGKDSSGDDNWAKKTALGDIDKLIRPDGSIDLKDLWEPRIATLALDCIKSHAQLFVNEVVGLAGTRFAQIKEFLIAQLRGLIGLPKWLLPFSSDNLPFIGQSTLDPLGQHQQNAEQESIGTEAQGTDNEADMNLEEDNLTQKVEAEPAVVIVAQEELFPSSNHPDQRRKQRRPSPASDNAQSLRAVQEIDSTSGNTDKTDEFLAWFVDSVVDELQSGYFANAKAAAVSRVESTEPQPTNSNGVPDEAGERACAWMKERIEKVLQ
ncbi:hypothetical protein BGZ95_004501 [Linnemannia exigua]|uniref:Uncharacterized protein n=1 Tax=Linnemannia exigua TaxID=604196 RepID=A0AAD4H904_9FUNG|nr:hypothetical protein BGZ95_004501 [Linnemannia exigua]